jgi:molecular chaperone GrpE
MQKKSSIACASPLETEKTIPICAYNASLTRSLCMSNPSPTDTQPTDSSRQDTVALDASEHHNPAAEPDIAGNTALQATLDAAETALANSKEANLRLAADMENLRRRTQEEVARAHKFALEGFAESLLPVRDALEMALAVDNQSPENLLAGVSATLRQLEAAFERGKIMPLNPIGEKFDPNTHQSVAAVPGSSLEPAVPANHVVAVLQKGYRLNERVLRPALVTVAQ